MTRQHLLRALLLGLRGLGGVAVGLAHDVPAALRSNIGVLVLPGLARLARGLAFAGSTVGGHVRRRLAGLDRALARAVAALAHDRRLARLVRLLLRELAQRALVVHRHDLHP